MAIRSDGHGLGDDPYYINQIVAWMKNSSNDVTYETYFDANSGGVNSLITGGSFPQQPGRVLSGPGLTPPRAGQVRPSRALPGDGVGLASSKVVPPTVSTTCQIAGADPRARHHGHGAVGLGQHEIEGDVLRRSVEDVDGGPFKDGGALAAAGDDGARPTARRCRVRHRGG